MMKIDIKLRKKNNKMNNKKKFKHLLMKSPHKNRINVCFIEQEHISDSTLNVYDFESVCTSFIRFSSVLFLQAKEVQNKVYVSRNHECAACDMYMRSVCACVFVRRHVSQPIERQCDYIYEYLPKTCIFNNENEFYSVCFIVQIAQDCAVFVFCCYSCH